LGYQLHRILHDISDVLNTTPCSHKGSNFIPLIFCLSSHYNKVHLHTQRSTVRFYQRCTLLYASSWPLSRRSLLMNHTVSLRHLLNTGALTVARQSTKDVHTEWIRRHEYQINSLSHVSRSLGFPPVWVATRGTGLDDLDLSMVLSRIRLLERHRRPGQHRLTKG
jgi:hypothetical protein